MEAIMAQKYTFSADLISDLHKDAYGMRPSPEFMVNWKTASDDQKQEIWDDLIFELTRTLAEEKAENDRAMIEFERKITDRLAMGYDRKAAIRSIIGALNENETIEQYGGSYVCYLLNLPYSMTLEIDRALA